MAQSRQKSYADTHRRELQFTVGDYVYLRISPTKGVMKFGKNGKLSLQFVGPFEIPGRVGPVVYRYSS